MEYLHSPIYLYYVELTKHRVKFTLLLNVRTYLCMCMYVCMYVCGPVIAFTNIQFHLGLLTVNLEV
jgi:hypothetical protein